jgi:hypothetical protein
LFPDDPFLLLILWFCKLTNPSLPALFCFHPDNPLVITSNLCLIPGPSPFHSSNLCLYPTIHYSRHLFYICIRTFLSVPSPVDVCIRTIVSLFTFSNVCFFTLNVTCVSSLYTVVISGPSSTRYICTVFVSIPSPPPLYPLCPYSNHHLLFLSALYFLSVSFKLRHQDLVAQIKT